MATVAPNDRLLTHANCLDGTVCAILFYAYGGKKENIHYSNPDHTQSDRAALKLAQEAKRDGANLVIADLSISLDAAEKLSDYDVVLYDHHKSAIPLSKFSWCHVDKENSACGAALVLKHYLLPLGDREPCHHPSDLTYYIELANLADDRDRWIKQFPASQALADLFAALTQELFFQQFCEPHVWPNELERKLLEIQRRIKNTYIERLENKTDVRSIDGHKIGFVYCEPKYSSDAGHHLIDKFNLDGVVLISPETISLRASDTADIDMSRIAKAYGGGGHKCAAGFSVKSLLGDTFSNLVRNSFALEP